MTFGKYKGNDLEDVPRHYLKWLIANCDIANPELDNAIRSMVGDEIVWHKIQSAEDIIEGYFA